MRRIIYFDHRANERSVFLQSPEARLPYLECNCRLGSAEPNTATHNTNVSTPDAGALDCTTTNAQSMTKLSLPRPLVITTPI
jgi:hypothetical protein